MKATATHMHCHVHQEEVFSVLSGFGEAALGGARTVQLRGGDVLRVAPATPRCLRALPAGPLNPGGADLRVLVSGGSTLGGPFPTEVASRALLDDRLALYDTLPPWLPPGSAEAAAAAALNAAQAAREGEHGARLGWRLAERTAAELAVQQRRAAAAPDAPPPSCWTIYVSAVALLDDAGRVLLAQRPPGKKHAGLWEFAGGKLEPGESPQVALARELAEELDTRVQPNEMFPLAFSSDVGVKSTLVLMLFGARRWGGTPRGAEGQAVRWVTAEELGVRFSRFVAACSAKSLAKSLTRAALQSAELPMPPADVPMLPAVRAAMRAAAAGYSDASCASAAFGATGGAARSEGTASTY